MLSSEELFFNYASVCSEVLVDIGSLDVERNKILQKCEREGNVPTKELLESSYVAAFGRIKKLAEKMGIDDYWDVRVIREYWHNEHNKIIDARDGNYSKFPKSFCEYCKVHIASVIQPLEDGFYMIEYDKVKRPVKAKNYLGELSLGERVRVHQAMAIERVEN